MEDEGNKLFVGSLSYNTTDDALRETFEKYGAVVEAQVITDRDTGRSRGFGFVTFEKDSAADDAISALHDTDLDGRSITVARAKKRQPGGGRGGGSYRGRGGGGRDYDRDGGRGSYGDRGYGGGYGGGRGGGRSYGDSNSYDRQSRY